MARVRVEHLGQLADGANGAFTIGELIRQLIYVWLGNRVSRISFHSGAANNLKDWDGYLSLKPVLGSDVPFLSVWEVSVEKKALDKIRRDFKESFDKDMPSDWRREETTFVAVTLRKLAKPGALRNELLRQNNGRWKDIQIIDAPALEQWLEKCPSISDWCADFLNIGGGRYGLSLSQFWKRWSTSTEPAMTKELVLAGRGDQDFEALTSPLAGKHISLQFDEPNEGVAYLSAVFDSIEDENKRGILKANTLVINDPVKAQEYEQDYVARDMVPVTILMAPANRAASTLKAAGHFVISVVGRSERTNLRLQRVPRALYRDLANALHSSMGVAEEAARREARAAGGSVSAWAVQSMLQNGTFGNIAPSWLDENRLKATLPAIFCDAWDSSSEQDRDVISQLAGISYDDFQAALAPVFHENSALLEKKNEIVYVVAPLVSFHLAAQHVSDNLLLRLSQVIRRLFVDDIVDVDFAAESARFLPTPSVPRYSEWLTRGLAETILRISAFAEDLDRKQFPSGPRGSQAYVDAIISPIAARAGAPAFLVALGRHLPLFMEASPKGFLDALEESLEAAVIDGNSEWAALFRDAGFSRNPRYDYLQSGLEVLAWSPDNLQQVVHVLMLLSQFAKNEKGEYRTLRALQAIFEAWAPGTSADLHIRSEVLKSLADKHPELTWELCKGLLPKMAGSIIDRTNVPMWKDFGRSTMEVVTHDSIGKSLGQYVSIALSLCSQDAKRQHELLEAYPRLLPSHRETLREYIANTVSAQTISDEMRTEFAATLMRMIRQHRRFSNMDWSLPAEEVQHLEVLRRFFEPRDSSEEILELLEESLYDYIDEEHGVSQARREEKLSALIREIVSEKGLESLLVLSLKCNRPYAVIEAFSSALTRRELRNLFVLACQSGHEAGAANLIGNISRQMLYFVGALWPFVVFRLSAKHGWSDDALSACLKTLPLSVNLQTVLEAVHQDVVDTYWKQREILPNQDGDLKNESAMKLVEYGRATYLMIQPLNTLTPQTAIQVLNAVIAESSQSGYRLGQNWTMMEHTVRETLSWLDECEDVSKKEIVWLEYRMMPLLWDSKRPLQIHKLLAEDPEAFIQILSHVYLPEDTPDDYVATEFERRRADHAWNVLDKWKSAPGLDEHGVIDSERLAVWVGKAREHGRIAGRVRISDYYIGKTLGRVAKVVPGEAWPPESICSLLEAISSADLDEGMVLQALESRNETSRLFGEGGAREQKLAEQWSRRASLLDMKWRRARRICDEIADNWSSQAQSLDRFTDLQRLRMNR